MRGDRRPARRAGAAGSRPRGRVLAVMLALSAGGITLGPAAGLAWGPEGHRIVAALAEARLDPEARRAVRDLLDGDSLVAVATWADDIRKDRPETASWHYVNIPRKKQDYDPRRDCARPHDGDCVVAAIERFHAVLADRARPDADRAEALKFLVHFVADVHQPLHCIKDHEGGNRIPVRFFGEEINPFSQQPWNLHALWDSALIHKSGLSEEDWGRRLDAWLAGRPESALTTGTAAEWALESHRAADQTAFRLPKGRRVGVGYLRKSLPVIEERLALAGVRLAALLNRALGN